MNSLEIIRVFAIFGLLLSAVLSGSSNEEIATVALVLLQASGGVICITSIFRVALGRSAALEPTTIALLIFFISFILWSWIRMEDISNLFQLAKLLFVLTFLWSLLAWRISTTEKNALSRGALLIILLAWMLPLMQGHPLADPAQWYVNPNYFGALLLLLLYFPLTAVSQRSTPGKFIQAGGILTCIVGIYVSQTRSAMLGVIAASILYFQNRRRPTLLNFVNWFFVCGLFVYAADYFIANIDDASVTDWSLTTFGKRPDTGRMVLWENILRLIIEKPAAGWGFRMDLSDLTGERLSAHNGYLQIALELGITGLAIFLGLVASILKALWPRRDASGRAAFCVFAGILTREFFEVTLLQNNAPLTLLIWLVVGMGISTNLKHAIPSLRRQMSSDRPAY